MGGKPVRDPGAFLVFGAPSVGADELAGIGDCISRRWIGTGPKAAEFEREFARYKGADHAASVSSCTAALHLSMLALGCGPGDEVITSAMTFCSTVNAIVHTGATPVLADCDPSTFNITAEEIERKITPRTKAVIAVHMCGRCCDMGPIVELCQRHNLRLIEDCAHAIESVYHGTPAGLMGDAGCFSFYATKNLTTGEGGMVISPHRDVVDQVKGLSNHGMSDSAWRRYSDSGYRHYTVERAGFKYNMPDLNAAIGLVQLAKLEARSVRRREIWDQYMERLAELPWILPAREEEGTRHAHHLFTPLLDLDRLATTRDGILNAITAENIGVGVHYLPVHEHPLYSERWDGHAFPNAEMIGRRTLSLPLTADMSDADVDDVCRAFGRVFAHFSHGH